MAPTLPLYVVVGFRHVPLAARSEATSASVGTEGGRMSACGTKPKYRKVVAMSAVEVLSGLVLLNLSFSHFDPQRTSVARLPYSR